MCIRDRLGQGKEKARNFLKENKDLADEIEKKIFNKLGIGSGAATDEDIPMDVPGADDPLTDEAVDLVPNVDFDDE